MRLRVSILRFADGTVVCVNDRSIACKMLEHFVYSLQDWCVAAEQREERSNSGSNITTCATAG